MKRLLITFCLTLLLLSMLAPTAPARAQTPVPVERPTEEIIPLAPEPEGESEAARNDEVDPWEGFNRSMHGFNRGLDRYVAKPLARGYQAVTPRPLRSGISNFFLNLFQPLTAAHQLLQGKPGQAGTTLGRFALNVVLGLGGLFDPATDAGIPLRQEDLGQTLAVWGWKDSHYLVLPFFGPSTTRDGLGIAGDAFASPYRLVDDDEVEYGLRGLQLISDRANLLGAEEFIKDADDEYLIFRDAYLQRRQFQIRDGRDQTPDYLLEEFEFEDFDDDAEPPPDAPAATHDDD